MATKMTKMSEKDVRAVEALKALWDEICRLRTEDDLAEWIMDRSEYGPKLLGGWPEENVSYSVRRPIQHWFTKEFDPRPCPNLAWAAAENNNPDDIIDWANMEFMGDPDMPPHLQGQEEGLYLLGLLGYDMVGPTTF